MSATIQREGHPGQHRNEDSSGFTVDPRETAFELELTAQDLSEFLEPPVEDSTRANPSVGSGARLSVFPRTVAAAARAQRLRLSLSLIGLSLSVVATGILVGLAHRSSTPQRAVDEAVGPRADIAVAAAVAQPPTPAEGGLPVRFRNPFDRAEVFQFPPGTSVAEARAAVAGLLMKRARGRLPQRSRASAPHRTQLAARTPLSIANASAPLAGE
jgi:hypothetical protein